MEIMVHKVLKVHRVNKDHKVKEDELVWLDLKVPLVHLDQRVEKEM